MNSSPEIPEALSRTLALLVIHANSLLIPMLQSGQELDLQTQFCHHFPGQKDLWVI